MFNPRAGIKLVPFERAIVEYTDKLIEVAKRNGSRDRINHSGDWKTLEFMYKGFKILYPQSARDFEKIMEMTRMATRDNKGISHEGSAMLEYLMEVPAPLYRMIRVIFPNQVWDRKFVKQLVSHFPQMKSHV